MLLNSIGFIWKLNSWWWVSKAAEGADTLKQNFEKARSLQKTHWQILLPRPNPSAKKETPTQNLWSSRLEKRKKNYLNWIDVKTTVNTFLFWQKIALLIIRSMLNSRNFFIILKNKMRYVKKNCFCYFVCRLRDIYNFFSRFHSSFLISMFTVLKTAI